MTKGTIVTVIDADNYKDPEATPFEAEIMQVYEHEVIVASLETGRSYELYSPQITGVASATDTDFWEAPAIFRFYIF